jgi:predicted butyrate kinase (DUF1464 family)
MKPLFVLTQEQKDALTAYIKQEDADSQKVETILGKSKELELKMLQKMIEKNPQLFNEVKELAEEHISKYKKSLEIKHEQRTVQLKETEKASKEEDALALESLEKDLNDLFE